MTISHTPRPVTILNFVLTTAVLVLVPININAQSQGEVAEAIASWIAVDAATGYENRTNDVLVNGMSGWTQDQWGNVIATVGSGAPHTVLACALDRPSHAVTQITADGYLRLHRIGRGSRHPLWDQAFQAQPVRIFTKDGPITGTIPRINGHFTQQHRGETAVATADDLWLDVGAESADEATQLGIELLDPVSRQLPPWSFEGFAAGPDAGQRVGCAAVVALAGMARQSGAINGQIDFVLSAQSVFGWVGLSSHIARGSRVDDLIVLAQGQEETSAEVRPIDRLGRLGGVAKEMGASSATWIAPAVRQAGSHMEIVSATEAEELLTLAADAAGIEIEGQVTWIDAPAPAELRGGHFSEDASELASLLDELVETFGTPGHEWDVRRYVLESLPEWARERAVVDDVGNIFVEAGPEQDTTVFMAHLDEVGYEVQQILPDGTVTLSRSGGAVSSAWEGQTALLYFDPPGTPSTLRGDGSDTNPRWKEQSLTATAPEPLKGVFLTRMEADQNNPGTLQAWFGMDGGELRNRGVIEQSAVIMYKDGLRLGENRFVARALDDRAGTAALIQAIHEIDPDRLPAKVIFAWSVHEEGGLVGAAAMAKRFAATAHRIYSVDTFVSSDTPLETPHFAFTTLGGGPVIRAIDSSNIAPDYERERIMRVARREGISIQVGLGQGSTDGTPFTYYGAPNQGLSWSGRYSHSPGEVLDLRDLANLRDLVVALANEGG